MSIFLTRIIQRSQSRWSPELALSSLQSHNTCPHTHQPLRRNSTKVSEKLSNEQGTQIKNTVIAEEVEKFSKICDSWWDPEGMCKPLHSMNDLRVPFVRDGLIHTQSTNAELIHGPTPLKGLKILDVGCGGGILCEPLARLGAEVTGIDASQDNIRIASLHAAKDSVISSQINYIHGSVEDHLEDTDEQYDALVVSEVIEHVAHPHYFIDTCSALVKSKGSLFLTTINKTQASWLGAIVAAEYLLRLLPEGTHDWEKFITPEQLESMLQSNLFTTRLVHGMIYLPLFDRWIWSANRSVNYALHSVKDV